MGFLSSIFDFFKKIFEKVMSAIKKVIEALGPFLPLLIVAAFVFAPYLGPWLTEIGLTTIGSAVTTLGAVFTEAGLGVYGAAAVGLGVSALLFPENTSEAVDKIGDVIGDVVSNIGEAIGGGASSLLGSFFGDLGIVGVAAIGIAAWWLLSSDNSDQELTVVAGGES
jgi:hypothetical protein